MLHSLLFGNRPIFQNTTEISHLGKTDIYEQDDAYIVHAEVPGLHQEDIEVSATNNTIEIKANKDIELPKSFVNDNKNTRNYSYKRTFRFRKTLDENAISAKVNYGLLEIILPKKSATKIPISVQ